MNAAGHLRLLAIAPAVVVVATTNATEAAPNPNWGSVHFPVGQGCGTYHRGVAVAAWQSTLWADGQLTSTGAIDGVFGSGSTEATADGRSRAACPPMVA
jgi:hypothetical protein